MICKENDPEPENKSGSQKTRIHASHATCNRRKTKFLGTSSEGQTKRNISSVGGRSDPALGKAALWTEGACPAGLLEEPSLKLTPPSLLAWTKASHSDP